MVATKCFSNNTSDNIRHSALKSLYAEGFAGYYRVRHLKETSPNWLLLTPEKSLTMKQYRSSTNNSDGIISVSFSVRAPFILRSSSVDPPFELRSSSVQPPFELRSSSVQPPFELRSSFVQFSISSRSVLDQFSFGSRSVLVQFSFSSRSVLDQFSFDSRSSFVHPPFILRSGIEDRSKIDRRTNGESSEARRRCIETLMGNQGKGDPNKNFI